MGDVPNGCGMFLMDGGMSIYWVVSLFLLSDSIKLNCTVLVFKIHSTIFNPRTHLLSVTYLSC